MTIDSRPTTGQAATPVDTAALLGSVIRLATAQPALLIEHVQAHAALLALEGAAAAARLKRQALWWAVAFGCGLAGALLAGTAGLLWMTRPLAAASVAGASGVGAWTPASPWLLACVPAVPLLLATVCAAGGLGLFNARVPAQAGWRARLRCDLSIFPAAPR